MASIPKEDHNHEGDGVIVFSEAHAVTHARNAVLLVHSVNSQAQADSEDLRVEVKALLERVRVLEAEVQSLKAAQAGTAESAQSAQMPTSETLQSPSNRAKTALLD